MTPVQIKICGITNLKDAKVCAELGANMIGFNFYRRSPRYIEPKVARRLIDTIPTEVCSVGVFVDASAEEVRNTAKATGIRCVQLHGNASADICSELAHEYRVIRVFSTNLQFRPEEISPFSDCDVLVDAHDPNLRGGTGLTCDWSAARAARAFARFLVLSGGLTGQNVSQAIATVEPHAVDVCSGVERAPGVKDHRALEDFFAAVRMASSSTNAFTSS
jgi:phosphoribosylanthranilate isomerase